ncbi:hypothetical protein MMARE11_27770 [Mycobacterium marinum E11]|nr:hypothetical protein MMARE11_27770 [Mycobacterium marinum E11]
MALERGIPAGGAGITPVARLGLLAAELAPRSRRSGRRDPVYGFGVGPAQSTSAD